MPTVADEKNPIVGHKTFHTPHGTRHEPLRQDEAESILARLQESKAKRAADMPTEQDAIRAMFNARERLKELGWSEGQYMPTTGERFAGVQNGSTGIHAMTATRDEGPFGALTARTIWTTYDGDIWPSNVPPVLYRPWRETDVQRDNGLCWSPEQSTAGVPALPAGHWRCACGTVLKGGAAHMNCPAGVREDGRG